MWPLKVILFFINILESPLSFSLNSCIVLIHVKNLSHGVKVTPSDLIQLVMGATNLTMRGLMLVNGAGFWLPMYYEAKVMHTTVILVPFHLYFNYWLIAWLSTLYWTSITNLKHQICVWIKRGLSSFTPHLLLLSALVSLAIALPPIWGLHFGVPGQNSTLLEISLTGFNFIPLACASICLSLSIILVSLTLTMFSLLTHVRSMKTNSSGLRCPSVQAHVSAVRTMALLLLLSVIISTADLIIFQPPPGFRGSAVSVAWLILGFFPTLEASIIIQSSPKLRKVFLQTSCAGKSGGGQYLGSQ
ncbi:PREDICTED: taste receptor type 2 member 9-like [Nanorana parkeri]|uniref:taste receptor type 2 member 9-like n=1 Tax=Nanorana parkeri TaxID=125878 RepID=UPI0008543FB5|nr:PREDICTED: taste receptor type 2 member 9-like [Nanorana parkeri]